MSETGHCVGTVSFSKPFPSFFRWSLQKKKKNTAKGKEAFQGKVVVLDSLVNFFGKTFPISAIHSRLQE